MTEASRYKVDSDDLAVHLIEDRRSFISPYGKGNSKIGKDIFTYSSLPGNIYTCVGSSDECEAICYAKRLVQNNPVWEMLTANTKRGSDIPPLPKGVRCLRWHISGDFGTVEYVNAWTKIVKQHPEVIFFGYTRSWRIPEMLVALNELRLLPNVHLWASMDKTINESVPDGWRTAWLSTDVRLEKLSDKRYKTVTGKKAIVCPEQTGNSPDCQSCQFCFKPGKLDLVFLEH